MNARTDHETAAVANVLPLVRKPSRAFAARTAALDAEASCAHQALQVRDAFLRMPNYGGEPELMVTMQAMAQWIRRDPNLRSYTGIADDLDRYTLEAADAWADDRSADA